MQEVLPQTQSPPESIPWLKSKRLGDSDSMTSKQFLTHWDLPKVTMEWESDTFLSLAMVLQIKTRNKCRAKFGWQLTNTLPL